MIADVLNQFADNTPLNTGVAGTYVIGNQIDTLVDGQGLGVGVGPGNLYLVVTASAGATSAGAATASFELVTSDNPDLSAADVLLRSGPVAVADIDRGAKLFVSGLPVADAKRYLGLRQVTGTAAFTGGAINAFLTTTPPGYRQYAEGQSA